MIYGIPSATYREGTQAHGFRDVGFCLDIAFTTGILEKWKYGIWGTAAWELEN
jgi:hypothetical protein